MTGAKSWLQVDEAESAPAGVHVLRVSGELDLGTISGLHAAVEERCQPGARIVLDLGGLTFCDSTGLGSIIKLHRRLTDGGGVLALCAAGPRVTDVLAISGVDQVISVYPSLTAALRALTTAA
jgi:anti-sigma B factor antagonist